MSARRLVLCGEPQRGDDAAAHVARLRLDPALVTGVDVRTVGGVDVDDLRGLGGQRCVIADTVTGRPPGELLVCDLAGIPGAAVAGRHSTHVLALPELLSLVCTLEGGAVRGTFVGIAGTSFGLGAPLSAPVEASMADFVTAIENALTGEGDVRCA